MVAEGAETMDAVACLREAGCDIVQGYALGRLMPADAATRMLQHEGMMIE